MRRSYFRQISSFLLILAMWLSVIGIAPNAVFAQTASDPKKDDKKDKNDKKETTAKQTKSPTGLAVNEDPGMIGKRNINSGSDKFFGWLGGSREKEAAIGRQLAMEVEQQSKMVEDPLITEYVNRVGQNIVLHSDAKIPFTIKVIDSDEPNAFALPGVQDYLQN